VQATNKGFGQIFSGVVRAKILKKALTFKKYYQMIGVAVGTLFIYYLVKKNPLKTREILIASNDYIKYLPIDKTSSSTEFKEYFANKKVVDFVYTDATTDDVIDKIFNKKRPDGDMSNPLSNPDIVWKIDNISVERKILTLVEIDR
jgi:hypothetical protein